MLLLGTGSLVFAWPFGFRGEYLRFPEVLNYLMGSFMQEIRGYKLKEFSWSDPRCGRRSYQPPQWRNSAYVSRYVQRTSSGWRTRIALGTAPVSNHSPERATKSWRVVKFAFYLCRLNNWVCQG